MPGVEMVMVAVEGVPETTSVVPSCTPSSVKLMVPVGAAAPVAGGVMVADNWSVPPAEGVVVAGVRTTAGVLLETVRATVEAVDGLKLVSPA